MAASAARVLAPAFVDRARGRKPSRARSLLTSAVIGAATGVLAYRLLRSGGEAD